MSDVKGVYTDREELVSAAAGVVGRRENGSLAEAVWELADAVAIATGKERHA